MIINIEYEYQYRYSNCNSIKKVSLQQLSKQIVVQQAEQNSNDIHKHDSKYKSNIIQFNGLTNLLHEMVVPAHWLQDSLNHYFGPKEGISCIMAGMGYNPVGLVDIEDFYSKTALQQLKDYLNIIDSFLYEKRLRNMEKVNTLPTHYEYLKENIYNGEE